MCRKTAHVSYNVLAFEICMYSFRCHVIEHILLNLLEFAAPKMICDAIYYWHFGIGKSTKDIQTHVYFHTFLIEVIVRFNAQLPLSEYMYLGTR